MYDTPHTCKNCGNSFAGKFCNQCGEKIYSEQDKSVSHLFHEVFHFFTHFDAALPLTLKTIFTHPGKYALDFCKGIRKKYFKPVPLFLLLVVLYLFFPKFTGLNMRVGNYTSEQYNYSWYARPVVVKKMKEQKASFEEIEKAYDTKSPKIAKVCLILLIPFAAVISFLLFYRSKKLYFDHFILGCEICSFYILLIFLIVPLLKTIFQLISPELGSVFVDGSWLSILFAILLALFILIAFRRFFGQKWSWSILKTVLFFFLFFEGADFVYKIIVFYSTMLFV